MNSKIDKVLKFGGTSVGTTERLHKVKDIILASQKKDSIAVCVSAMSGTTKKEGTTSRLLNAIDAASNGKSEGITSELNHILEFHKNIINATIKDQTRQSELLAYVEKELHFLQNFLEALLEIGEVTPRSRDRVISVGEILSAKILSEIINDSQKENKALFINLNQIMMDEEWNEADGSFFRILEEKIGTLVLERAKDYEILVLTGYVGRIPGGIIEKIGRGYTDYTAALTAAGSGAGSLEIWKEVDGIFSADPRKVSDAHVIPHISYLEAAELTFFGTEAIHPRTMEPCIRREIPIRVKNVLNPEGEGTLVNKEKKPSLKGIGKALTQKSNIAVVNIESDRMNEAPGFIYNMGEIFYKHQVSIDLMATSEVSVSTTVHGIDSKKLQQLAEDLEKIGSISIIEGYSSISIIGHGMQHNIGVAGKVFSTLANNKINIVLISQGASELSISFIVEAKDAQKTIDVLHKEFLSLKK